MVNVAVHIQFQLNVVKIVFQCLITDFDINLNFRRRFDFLENFRRMRNFQRQILDVLGVNQNCRLVLPLASGGLFVVVAGFVFFAH